MVLDLGSGSEFWIQDLRQSQNVINIMELDCE